MMNRMVAMLVVVCLVSPVLVAEEKAASKPSGTYVREAGEAKVSMAFKGNNVVIKVVDGDTTVTVHAAYGITGDVLFGSMTKVEKSGSDGPEDRDLFSFKIKVSKGELTVSDLRGTHSGEEAKRLVEGTYKTEK